jgi:hypothetical protein
MEYGKKRLRVRTEQPVSGYWDGGQKSTFDFSVEGEPQKDEKGYYARVGSWDANYWFNVGAGKTKPHSERQILASAKKKIKMRVPYTTEVI